jgi:Membrane-associating domain
MHSLYSSPDRVNFLIFNGIWTALLVVPFLTLAPRYFPRAAHPYAILAVEALTMLFWFAGFIAHAVFVSALMYCRGNVCRCAQAASVFAAFEWSVLLPCYCQGLSQYTSLTDDLIGCFSPRRPSWLPCMLCEHETALREIK